MRKFSEIVNESIQGLEGYSEEEIIQQVRLKTEQVESDLGPGDFRVKQITIIGSRTRSEARPDSDLDVLVEYEGRLKEYAVFNILNEDPLYIEDIPVDINPIRKEESGTTEEWLRKSQQYLNSK
jgi:predicted nucleotidyltransferase